MLKNWSVENFKTLANTQTLTLTPMTILVNDQQNDTTGLLQSIAVLAQTMSVQGFHQALATNGPFVQAGTFTEIVGGNTSTQTLRAHFELDFQSNEDEQDVVDLYKGTAYNVDVTFVHTPEPRVNLHQQESEHLHIASLTLGFRFEVDLSSSSRAVPEVPALDKEEGENAHEYNTRYTFSEGALSLYPISQEDEREVQEALQEYPQLRVHYQRHSLFIGTLVYPPNRHKPSQSIGENDTAERFLVGLSGFLPQDLVRRPHGKIIGLHSTKHVSLLRGAMDLEKASEQMTDYFSNRVYYLSRQRLEAGQTTPRFMLTSKLDQVGAQGEFAIGVYHANQQTPVRYYDPESGTLLQLPLQEALDNWLRYLGIAEQAHTRQNTRNKLSWRVFRKSQRAGQKLLPLAASNSEFVQIVPLLLLGLLTPENSLLLIEHPDQLLNMQTLEKLADFFSNLTRLGKQCILEVSNQIFLQALCRQSALDQCHIYTAHRDSKGTTRLVLQPSTVSAGQGS